MPNTCVNTRKDTGVDEPCYTMGNSAWDPDVPLQDPTEFGWKKGYSQMYWFTKEACSDGGCPMEGTPDFTGAIETINFTNYGEFVKQSKNFPKSRFSAVFNGKLGIAESGEYEFTLNSAQGSLLWLDGYGNTDIVVDNWSKHDVAKKSGKKYLGKGWHEINCEFFDDENNAVLSLKYKGPDTAGTEQLVPAWHDPNI